ncbi:50S ribosomal protein L17 [bacterium]|nr:MAG: 50S ribosomal protein L17 [bacterium]
MRHHDANRKFGREKKVRTALFRSLAVSLIRDEKIKTTEAKAKELRPFMEKLVTKSRGATLASRRILIEKIGGERAVKKMIEEIAPRYEKRTGGYTRITKVATRAGDASKMAIIEFV